MITLFECRIRYEKIDSVSGKEKMVTETYLFDALSYTEAEARIASQMPEYISGEFMVVSIRKAKYGEIIPTDDGDRWFKAKISFITVDEKAGKEKKISQTVLVLASGIKDAFDKIIEAMNGTTDDFEINAISETQIMDYFPLFEKDAVPADREIARRPASEAEEEHEAEEEPTNEE